MSYWHFLTVKLNVLKSITVQNDLLEAVNVFQYRLIVYAMGGGCNLYKEIYEIYEDRINEDLYENTQM